MLRAPRRICDPDARRAVLHTSRRSPAVDLLQALDLEHAERQPGDAVLVFPSGEFDVNGFLRYLSLVHKLPQRVLLVRTTTELVPHVPLAQRTRVRRLGPGLHLVDVHYGYEDEPDLASAMGALPSLVDTARARYWVVDDRDVTVPLRGMAKWRSLLFRVLSAASVAPAQWLHLPPERTVALKRAAPACALPGWLEGEPTPRLPPQESTT
jgi:KUP system potassium uptake protein